MREFLINLFDDNAFGLEIGLFSIWHFVYIILIVGLTFLGAYLLKNKAKKTKTTVLNVLSLIVIILYVADFFFQPLYTSDNEMMIEKLPFHICTFMGIMAVFAQFNKKFQKIKEPIVVLSIVATLMYITYPGSALGGVSPLSYRVIETFLFHGTLFAWGVLNLTTGTVALNFKNIWQEFAGLIIIALWANLGNNIYSSVEHHYDWFFMTGSTFPFIPSAIMPFVVVLSVFTMVVIIYSIYYLAKTFVTKQVVKDKTISYN